MFEGVTIFNKYGEVIFSYPSKHSLAPHITTILSPQTPSITPLSSLEILYKIKANDLLFITITDSTTPPLAVETIISKFIDTIKNYLDANLDSKLISKNHATLVRLYGEMLDTGIPRITEPDIIKQLVQQPTQLSLILGKSEPTSSAIGAARNGQTLPSHKLLDEQSIPEYLVPWPTKWRRSNVTHKKEEVLVDVVEQVECTLINNNNSSSMQSATVLGDVILRSRLSGFPHLKISLSTPNPFKFPRYHKSVSASTMLQGGNLILELTPPDGLCRIMQYKNTMPFQGIVNANLQKSKSQFTLSVSTMIATDVSDIENLKVVVIFPPQVKSVSEISSTSGDFNVSKPTECVYSFNEPVPTGWKAQLQAVGHTYSNEPVMPLYAKLSYTHINHLPSKLKVSSIDVRYEQINMNPANPNNVPQVFKGVKYTTQMNSFVVC